VGNRRWVERVGKALTAGVRIAAGFAAALHDAPRRFAEGFEREGNFPWHARCMAPVRPNPCAARASPPLYERGIMKRLIALALAATFALPSFALLTGCNTVEGAGKDIQAGGSKIKEEARENKKY
jgi:predicted small secreted protein